MQAEIIIFILTCLAVAALLILATHWFTRARWRTRLDMASGANIRYALAASTAAQSRLDEAVADAEETAREEGIEEGRRSLACANAKAYNQKEVLGLSLAVSQRGRVRVRIVDGDGGHHLLLHSPAGYKNKARATKILERLLDARLLRVEDYEVVEAVEDEAEGK